MDRLSAMRLFVRIVQTGSFTQGARAIGISSATATQRIASLESELGVKLLNRTTRAISLTEQGETCFNASVRILDQVDELEFAVGTDRSVMAGVVRVNCNASIARALVLPRLTEFTALYPDIRLQLIMSDIRANFVRERLDFSVRIGGLEDQDLLMRKLGRPRRLTVASPAYLAEFGEPKTPAELKKHRLVDFLLPNGNQVLNWEFEKSNTVTEMRFGARVAVNDAEARIKLALDGLGIAQTVGFMAAPYLQSGELMPVLRDCETDAPDASILYQKNRHRPQRISVALDFFTEIITEGIRAGNPLKTAFRAQPVVSKRTNNSKKKRK
jgi:LysR family transcriptional regulator for bpeEF and oprC